MATDGSYSLDEVADRLAIGQVIARYVHALDARDYKERSRSDDIAR